MIVGVASAAGTIVAVTLIRILPAHCRIPGTLAVSMIVTLLSMDNLQQHQSGRTPNLSLIRYRRISDQAQFQSFAHAGQGSRGGSFGITLVSAAFARTHSS